MTLRSLQRFVGPRLLRRAFGEKHLEADFNHGDNGFLICCRLPFCKVVFEVRQTQSSTLFELSNKRFAEARLDRSWNTGPPNSRGVRRESNIFETYIIWVFLIRGKFSSTVTMEPLAANPNIPKPNGLRSFWMQGRLNLIRCEGLGRPDVQQL